MSFWWIYAFILLHLTNYFLNVFTNLYFHHNVCKFWLSKTLVALDLVFLNLDILVGVQCHFTAFNLYLLITDEIEPLLMFIDHFYIHFYEVLMFKCLFFFYLPPTLLFWIVSISVKIFQRNSVHVCIHTHVRTYIHTHTIRRFTLRSRLMIVGTGKSEICRAVWRPGNLGRVSVL